MILLGENLPAPPTGDFGGASPWPPLAGQEIYREAPALALDLEPEQVHGRECMAERAAHPFPEALVETTDPSRM
jgi:hypothetical protein